MRKQVAISLAKLRDLLWPLVGPAERIEDITCDDEFVYLMIAIGKTADDISG